MNSNKQVIGKYNLLHKILADPDCQIDQAMYQTCLKFAVTGVQHPIQDVRQSATKCIVELYKNLGEGVRGALAELRPAQLEQVEIAMADANPG